MTPKGVHCLNCKKSVVEIDTYELIEDGRREHDKVVMVAELFNYFKPYVCPDCGFTMFYATDKLMRDIHDIVSDQGGHG